jgi:hypothetical protein
MNIALAAILVAAMLASVVCETEREAVERGDSTDGSRPITYIGLLSGIVFLILLLSVVYVMALGSVDASIAR